MICVPVSALSAKQSLHDIRRACLIADAVELRMDMIAGGVLAELISAARQAASHVRIIVTCRNPEEASPAGRVLWKTDGDFKTMKTALLKEAVDLGADYVDIELACGDAAIKSLQSYCRKRGGRTKVIISFHDVRKTPPAGVLKKIFQQALELKADVVKIVTYALKLEDNLKILHLHFHARKNRQKMIALCMGEKGKISRITAPFWGNFMNFASLERGAESAPGQLTAFEMRQIGKIIRENDCEQKTLLNIVRGSGPLNFALFGNPVAQSLSPLMHNAALAGLGIPGQYSSFCVSDIAAAVQGMRGMNIRGASVTIPFKTAIMEYLDDVSPDALAIGAVNTVLNSDGLLTGFNTDLSGLMTTLREGMEISGKKFIVIGAGGTARTAVYGIINEGGFPLIVNRSADHGKALARRAGCPFYPFEEIGKLKADCLINTTPVGMYPSNNLSPVDAKVLAGCECVMDVIYNPLKTKLLRDAEKKGCRIFSGLDMFVHQGAEQIRIWTGEEPDRRLMKKIVLEKLTGAG